MNSDVIHRLADALCDARAEISPVKKLTVAFLAAGKELYLVGGTVRDELLGRPSHDIDMATDALPDEIRAIVAITQPLHIIPIGEKFGTIQVHYPGVYGSLESIEITTYRGERYTPGSRKPEVRFGTSLVEDLRRRDFTINAIAKDPRTGFLVDPFHGQADLHNRYIRAVDDAEQRFIDDPLRLMRAARFVAQFGFTIAGDTFFPMRKQAKRLLTVSQERIRDELSKLLVCEKADTGLYVLLDTGLLDVILPEVAALVGVNQYPHHRLDVFGHTRLVIWHSPQRLDVRLAALLHDIAKPATRSVNEHGVTHFYEHEDIGAEMAATILRRLRFGNDVVERVSKIVKLHMRVNSYTEHWSTGAVRRLYVEATGVLDDLLDLAIADGISDRDERAEIVRARIEHLRTRMQLISQQVAVQPIQSPLNGEELMEFFGRGPGAWLRPVKQHLNDLVIDGVLPSDDKEAARQAARAFDERGAYKE